MKRAILAVLMVFASFGAWAQDELPATNFNGDVALKSTYKLTLYNDDYLYYGTSGTFRQRYNSSTGKLEITDSSGNVMWSLADSGTTSTVTIPGDVTLRKASPVLKADATSGNALVAMNGVAGSNHGFQIQVGGNRRWWYYTGNSEFGGNTGTDFYLARYSDAGAFLDNVMFVNRVNGNITWYGNTTWSGSYSLTIGGNAAVNGGTLSSSASTFYLVNANVTTLNMAGAATTVNIGKDNTSTINLKAGTIATGQTSLTLANTTATTVNAFGASTATTTGADGSGYTSVRNALITAKIVTFTANDTSPTVAGANIFKVPGTWTAGNNATALDDGIAGQQITIIGGDSDFVLTDGSALKLAGNWTGTADATIRLVYDGSNWYETGRSAN